MKHGVQKVMLQCTHNLHHIPITFCYFYINGECAYTNIIRIKRADVDTIKRTNCSNGRRINYLNSI